MRCVSLSTISNYGKSENKILANIIVQSRLLIILPYRPLLFLGDNICPLCKDFTLVFLCMFVYNWENGFLINRKDVLLQKTTNVKLVKTRFTSEFLLIACCLVMFFLVTILKLYYYFQILDRNTKDTKSRGYKQLS